MPNSKLIKFEKGGSAGSKGVDFQIGLLIVTYLKALKMKLTNWKLSSENKKAEKFDDVVLEWENGSVLLQAKFKENRTKITLEDLTSTNSKTSDFSLPKYYSCYQKIKNRFPYLKNVILCTNAELKIDDAMIKILNDKNYLSRDNILVRKNKCSLYTFNKSFVPALTIKIEEYFASNPKSRQDVSEENIKQFLEQLQLYCNYPSGKELNKVTEKLINQVENLSTWWSKTTSIYLYRKMMDWFQQEQGIYFTETHAKAVSCELRSDKYCETLEKYKVFFKTSTLTFSGKTQIFHVATNSLIDVIKVYRCLENNKERTALFVNPENDMEVFRVAIEAFTLPQYVFLVIVLPTITQENEVEEVCGKLCDVLQKEYKKLILLADSNNQLTKQILLKSSSLKVEVITETATYIDFTNETLERLKHKKNINFQGIDINLKELVGTPEIDNYKLILDSAILQKLLKDEKVTVGVKVPELDDHIKQFYMKRNLKMGEVVIASEDIYDKSGKIVLISDAAGMGKSTVFTKIGSIIKSKYPHLWVLRINLNDYTSTLKNVLERYTRTISVMELLSGKNETKLSTVFEEKVFLVKRIVLLMDGLDEVSPDYTELILNSLSQYTKQNNFEKILITTRPHVARELEEKLKVKSFSLEPLDKDSQIKYFFSFWTHNLNLQLENSQKEKCVKYAEELISKINSFSTNFVAMPLHMMMLAVIFQDNSSFGELSGRQGCKEFLSSGELVPKVTKEVNFTKLYSMFIRTKKRIFIDKVNPTANCEGISTFTQKFEKCLLYHRSLALQEMFPEETCKLFKLSYQPVDSDTEMSILRMGIVQKRGNIQFIHRTFTEYFVAESLLKELQDNNPQVEFQTFFIEYILLGYQFEVVRTFLDGFLKEVVTSLPSNLFTSYMCKMNIPIATILNINLLHNLASEGLVSLFELVLKSLNFKITRDKTVRVTNTFPCNILKRLEFNLQRGGVNIEDFKGKTPLHYAIKNNNIEMVLYLIEKGANLGRYSDELLDIAIKYVFLDMVKFLLEQGACITENHFISCICEGESYKKIEITSYLLKVVLDKNDLIVNEPITPYIAVYLGRLDILQSFSARDINGVIKNGEISSFAAVRANRLEILKYLYQKGVDINWKNFYGQNILHIACDENHLGIIKFLFDCNMDFNIPDNDDHTPLHLFALAGDVKNAEFFVRECNADINIQNNKGQTPLHLVALKGDLNSVQFLIKECNADLTIQDNKGLTPLHFTVLFCDLSTVRFLVKEFNANTNTQDKGGWTALHYAALRGDLRIIHFLVNECDANINALDIKGQTLLHCAALSDNTDTIQFFVKKCNADISVLDRKDQTPLHCAAVSGNSDTGQFLLKECNAEIDVRDDEGQTPLHCAALHGNAVTLKFLVKECKADINVMDKKGRTPLHCAAFGQESDIVLVIEKGYNSNIYQYPASLHYIFLLGCLDSIQFLVKECNRDVNAQDAEGQTPLHYAASRAYSYLVQILVTECNAKINVQDNKGQTVLHYAALNSDLRSIQFLVSDCNADINVLDNRGQTPLHCAALNFDSDTVQFLIKQCKADINVQDNEGRIPLHCAASSGDSQSVQFFVKECNIDVNIQDKKGQTPLHYAATSDDLHSIQLLVNECYADIDVQDRQGRTSLHCAALEGNSDIVEFLVKKCKANINTQDNEGRTALHCTALSGDSRSIHFLVNECDVDINALDNTSQKAFDLVPNNKRSSVINVLS